jgi:hypothetical protein
MRYQQFAPIGMPFKHRAAGSNPARLTNKINELGEWLSICAFGRRISYHASSIISEGYGYVPADIHRFW